MVDRKGGGLHGMNEHWVVASGTRQVDIQQEIRTDLLWMGMTMR